MQLSLAPLTLMLYLFSGYTMARWRLVHLEHRLTWCLVQYPRVYTTGSMCAELIQQHVRLKAPSLLLLKVCPFIYLALVKTQWLFATSLYPGINRCDPNPCQYQCTETVGSFVCTCFTGYSLNADQRTCSGEIIISFEQLLCILVL